MCKIKQISKRGKDTLNLLWHFKESHEARSLISNFSWLVVLQIASYLFPLITMPYLARVIGVGGFGKIAFASAVMVWVLTITDWGFNQSATRDIARNRNNKKNLSMIYSNVQYSRIFLMLCSLIILLILIAIIPVFRESWAVLLVTFLTVPGHILFPDWFFQGMERMKYTSILNIFSKTFFILGIFVFIRDEEDFILQPLLTSLGFLCAGLCAQFVILYKWGIKLKVPHWFNIKETIFSSTDIFINTLMPNLYNSFSIVLLGFWGGVQSNGLLDAGRRFVTLGQNFTSILTRAFYPFLSRRIDKHTFYVRISLSISTFIALFLFAFAPLLIQVFFTKDFDGAIIVLRIQSIGIIFTSLISAYGAGYMILEGYEKELRIITTVCSLIGFVMAFPLIYFYDYIGAAINVTAAQVLLGSCITREGRKMKNRNIKRL